MATYTFITSPIVVQTAATLDYYRQIVPAPSDQLRNGGGALRLILSWDSDSQGNIYAPKRIRGQRLQHVR